MALKGVLRPGYIQIRVTDLDAALTHYVDRVGLHEVSLVPVVRGPVYYCGNATIRRERPICSRSLLPRLSFCCISATGEIEIVK